MNLRQFNIEHFNMKITVVVALICFVLCMSGTNAALKLSLIPSLDLPIIGELNTDVKIGIDGQKGLLGAGKLLVKGLTAKAASSLFKKKLPKDTKSDKGNTPRLPLKLGKDVPK
ncbi:PREDICTED: uncharacterized protein LOC106118629 [Papilio xuthus]|uniref:Uncharacterized protein LOC106118629 n=1 Tax=Papilio xuthus TaxID=66420 RepID=A0A194QJI2_PAPXU|nr:PREDICTED: uncharacterized protein LOC106118629 [Papilio xuthus]KPJ05549.1 hypothetical protein RR46_02165 [Papilio xuthus]